MAIESTVKKKVIEDWQLAFPQLTKYAQNKLYKVVGPLVTGLELIKLPRTAEYRPHFVVYPLWKASAELSMKIPILLNEYSDNRELQYTIPYEKHDLFYKEVLNSVNSQTPLSFKDDISLKKILSILDDYSRISPLSAAPQSYLQAVLYEAKLKISLYISSDDANQILNQIQNKDWDVNHFRACGKDVSDWILGLHECIVGREVFLEQISINKKDKKIAKLQSSELLP